MRDLSSEDDYIPSFNSIVIPLLKSCNYADEKPLISNEVFDDGKTDKTFTSVRCLDFECYILSLNVHHDNLYDFWFDKRKHRKRNEAPIKI